MTESWTEISCTKPGEVYGKNKQYPDGLHVTISIYEIKNQFEIKAIAEHRCSGPNETSEGSYSSLSEAKKALEKECAFWDEPQDF